MSLIFVSGGLIDNMVVDVDSGLVPNRRQVINRINNTCTSIHLLLILPACFRTFTDRAIYTTGQKFGIFGKHNGNSHI